MSKARVYQIVEGICAVLMLIIIFSMLKGGSATISNADFKNVEKATLQGVDMTNMQTAQNRMIKRLYGLSAGDFEAISLYYPTTNMGAEEILLVQLADISQSDMVESAIAGRLATQKKSFDGYGIEQTELLNDYSIVDVQGNYILFVVNKNAQDIADHFEESL